MNDLRKEIERQFKAFGLSEPDEKATGEDSSAVSNNEKESGFIAAPADFEPE